MAQDSLDPEDKIFIFLFIFAYLFMCVSIVFIYFLCFRDDSQGGGIKICPCLSVRPFVTLYGIEFV